MAVCVVGVNNLESRDRTESRKLLNEGESGSHHSLRSDDRSEDGGDPSDPEVGRVGTSRNRLEEDVLNDSLGIFDESCTLSEVGEE